MDPSTFVSRNCVSMEDSRAVRDQAFVATQIAIDELGDAKLGRLLAYWAARRSGDELPSRQDLLPEEMGELLGRIALVDVDHVAQDFRFRLVGTQLRFVLGRDLTGQTFSGLLPAHFEALLRNYCSAAVTRRAPQCIDIVAKRDDQSFSYSTLILPLSSSGGTVDVLLLAFNWRASEVPLVDPLAHGPV